MKGFKFTILAKEWQNLCASLLAMYKTKVVMTEKKNNSTLKSQTRVKEKKVPKVRWGQICERWPLKIKKDCALQTPGHLWPALSKIPSGGVGPGIKYSFWTFLTGIPIFFCQKSLWLQSTFEYIISAEHYSSVWWSLLIFPLHRLENKWLVKLNVFAKITHNLILSLLAVWNDYCSLSWPFGSLPWNANNRNPSRFTWSLD